VHSRQDGYKAHVAAAPDTGLFTAGELTKAGGEENHEAVVGLSLLDDDEPARARSVGRFDLRHERCPCRACKFERG
jgi:hypothetical protein